MLANFEWQGSVDLFVMWTPFKDNFSTTAEAKILVPRITV